MATNAVRRGSDDAGGVCGGRGGTEAVRAIGDTPPAPDIPEEGRGTGCLEKSSKGGMTVGRGGPGFAETYLSAALLTSPFSSSSSRRCARSYMMDERTCSMRAAVTSSVTSFLCLSNARWRFWDIPSARRARICSYRSACPQDTLSRLDPVCKVITHLFKILQRFIYFIRPNTSTRL